MEKLSLINPIDNARRVGQVILWLTSKAVPMKPVPEVTPANITYYGTMEVGDEAEAS